MTADLSSVIRLDRTRLVPAAAMLALAFCDYPLDRYFAPEADVREKEAPGQFLTMVRYGLLYGEVYATSPALEGVAVWLPHDKVRRTLWRSIWSGDFSVFSRRDREQRSRHQVFIDYSISVHQRRAPFPHLYLQLIGVDPAHQGKGYGSLLMRHMFERIDKLHLPCYLETHAEENVAIYQHHGFKVVEEGIIPGSEIASWAMLRETPQEK